MNVEQLRDRIAYLESVNDQLQTEITYVDDLMKLLGFTDGLQTVKGTAQDMCCSSEEENLEERE